VPRGNVVPEQIVKSENEHDEKKEKNEKLEDVGEGSMKGHLLV